MPAPDYEMEYRQYVQWCEENRLPDYVRWESGYFMRGMEERRDPMRQGVRTDADRRTEQKGVKSRCGPGY